MQLEERFYLYGSRNLYYVIAWLGVRFEIYHRIKWIGYNKAQVHYYVAATKFKSFVIEQINIVYCIHIYNDMERFQSLELQYTEQNGLNKCETGV